MSNGREYKTQYRSWRKAKAWKAAEEELLINELSKLSGHVSVFSMNHCNIAGCLHRQFQIAARK
jgi:hypothetical protein